MVADGMSAGVPSLAEPFARLTRGRGTNWTRLAGDAGTSVGWFETASLSSLVTDSSAASTAWATGSRVFNASVNVLPDGTRLTPIGLLARDAGRRIGLVTTTTITHATPAGFVAVHPNRDDEEVIAAQYLNAVDVLLGGGRQFFDPRSRKDKRDLSGEYAAAGYALCDSRDALLRSRSSTRLLGLFSGSHVPYTIDCRNDADLGRSTPTLAEMAEVAIGILRTSRNGFLLQIEGGRVDHGAHANDAAAMLWEQLAFDDAIGVVLEFAQQVPDTLVVITADHGNSNPGLTGIGEEYVDSTRGLERIAKATASFGTIRQRVLAAAVEATAIVPATVIDLIQSTCGIGLSPADAGAVGAAALGAPSHEITKQHANFNGILAQVLGNHTGLEWAGSSHTSDVTMLMAVGPGREHFAGWRPNTDAYGAMTQLMGITHKNPSMSVEEAKRYLGSQATAETPHWL